MMKLTQSRLEDIMKSKVIKKRNNLSVKQFKNLQWSGKIQYPDLLQNFSPNPGTYPVSKFQFNPII